MELVCNLNLASSFGDEVNGVIEVRVSWLVVLVEEVLLRALEFSLHPLNKVVDHLIVIIRAVLATFEQMSGGRIDLDCILENLNGTQNSICLRDSLGHEVIELVLQG